MAQLNYSAQGGETNKSVEPMPKIDVIAVAVESEYTPTKSGKGKRLNIKFKVISDINGDLTYKGRYFWDDMNLENQNPDTVAIAQKQLNTLMFAVGKVNIRDSVELHNIPVIAKLKVIIDKSGQYEPKNGVRTYERAGHVPGFNPPPYLIGTPAPPAPAPEPQTEQINNAPASTPPWMGGGQPELQTLTPHDTAVAPPTQH